MVVETARNVRLFYAYAHEDRDLRDRLSVFLRPLLRNSGTSHIISEWHDREILPGTDYKKVIDENLNEAHIILLLISADFIASDYCYGIEMKKALERHNKGEAHVIPVILRPVPFLPDELSRLQMLPTDARPVTSWSDRGEAFVDIAKGVRKVINEFLKKRILDDAKIYLNDSQYEAALDAYEQVIDLIEGAPTPDDAFLYKAKGDTLVNLNRYQEALMVYDQAIHLQPTNSLFYVDKGKVLFTLNRYEDALKVYEEAIGLASRDPSLYIGKGDVLVELKRYEQAVEAYDRVIRLDNQNPLVFAKKGKLLFCLEHYKEALDVYGKAIYFDPKNAEYHSQQGDILFMINKYDEAYIAYENATNLEPYNMHIWRNKGQVLSSLNRCEDALKAYEKAIDLESQNPYLYKEKGDILLSLERLEDALKAYEDAVCIKSDFGAAFLSKSKVLERLARQAYKRAKKLGVTNWKPFYAHFGKKILSFLLTRLSV